MPREFTRNQRLSPQIQRALAELIGSEMKDPRLGMVTISDVVVSRDLSHAKVYVSSLQPEADMDGVVKVLKQATPFLRRKLDRLLHVRSVPQLDFIFDDTAIRGSRLSSLIDRAVQADAEHHKDGDVTPGE